MLEVDKVAAVFDRAATQYGRVGGDLFSDFGEKVARLAEAASGQAMLDVGCGTGALLAAGSALRDGSAPVVGVDLSSAMARRARQHLADRGLPGVVALADAQGHPFAGGVFDVVASNFALTYFPDPIAAVTGLRRVLRPGGRLVLGVADGSWFQDDSSWAWHEELLTSLDVVLDQRRFSSPEAVAHLLRTCEIVVDVAAPQTFEMEWADFHEWWAAGWTHGYRAVLEALGTSQLDHYRRVCTQRLTATPIWGELPPVWQTGWVWGGGAVRRGPISLGGSYHRSAGLASEAI